MKLGTTALATFSVLGLVEGGIQVLEPEEFQGVSISPLVARKIHLGRPDDGFNASVELALFTKENVEDICYKGAPPPTDMFKEKAIFIDRFYMNDFDFLQECFGDSKYYRDLEFYNSWCTMSNLIIVVETFYPGLYANDHDGRGYVDLKRAYPILEDCILLEVQRSEMTDQLTLILREESSVWVDLVVDPNECVALFGESLVQVFFRGLIGGLYITSALTSLVYLGGNQYRSRLNRLVCSIVLCVNAIVSIILGLVLLNGGWRISDGVSIDVSNFIAPMFTGSGAACDVLVAARYNQMKKEHTLRGKFKGNKVASTVWLIAIICFACALVVADWVSSFMFVYLNPGNKFMLMNILPGIFWFCQLVATGYLLVQVFGMVKVIRNIQSEVLRKGEMNEYKARVVEAQETLIKWLRFWLIITVTASIFLLLALVIVAATGIFETSCEGWVLVWGGYLFCKWLNILSQSSICGRSQGSRNEVSAVSTGETLG